MSEAGAARELGLRHGHSEKKAAEASPAKESSCVDWDQDLCGPAPASGGLRGVHTARADGSGSVAEAGTRALPEHRLGMWRPSYGASICQLPLEVGAVMECDRNQACRIILRHIGLGGTWPARLHGGWRRPQSETGSEEEKPQNKTAAAGNWPTM